MIGLALTVALIAAVAAVGLRRWQRNRIKYRRPGTSIFAAIPVEGFDEIDAIIDGQKCAWCDGRLAESGETSRSAGDRRYRIVRLVCHECERDLVLYFDVTRIFH